MSSERADGGLGDILELISISIYLELARIVVTLESDNMRESANSTIMIFPRRGRDTRDTVLWSNPTLIDILLAQVTRVLVPFE
jgi:hypothetical protein